MLRELFEKEANWLSLAIECMGYYTVLTLDFLSF